jgi:serine/threonine protein kinase
MEDISISEDIDSIFFEEIKKHPSFSDLTTNKQEELNNLIKNTIEDAKIGKWLINYKELEIESDAFASGTFSTIHNCKWRGLKIAVKKAKTNKIMNILEFLNEACVWSTLRHPKLVQFIGVSFINDNVCILLEKVEGKNLKEYLQSKTSSKSMLKKKEIISQLINIVKFLHNCNPPIIYRDLKPENILIDNYGNIKITDFGLSKYYKTTEDDNYIMTGNTGTVRYMAPEVYRSEKYDLKVDVYGLGLIMYYVITNEEPFIGNTIESMKIFFDMSDVIFSTRKVANKELRKIVNKCIDKNAEERYTIDDLYIMWSNFISTSSRSSGGCVIL